MVLHQYWTTVFFYFRVYIYLKKNIHKYRNFWWEVPSFNFWWEVPFFKFSTILSEDLKHEDLYSFVNLFNNP